MAQHVECANLTAARFTLKGHVQGIGVRPAIARLAVELKLNGRVGNSSSGVDVQVEGTAAAVDEFAERLIESLPHEAVVAECVRHLGEVRRHNRFAIESKSAKGILATPLPRDMAVCTQCLGEVADVNHRRHGYSFTSCTNCGPRYSIIESMPYERADTSMRSFQLCERCTEEYESATDRRFHAQANACSTCGPVVWSTDPAGRVTGKVDTTLQLAAQELLRGGIVALKGIGGYQLLCDATSHAAVARLRDRKQRRSKPFAVMIDTHPVDALPDAIAGVLDSPANPIVLVTGHVLPGLADNVQSAFNTVGLMRPTTPLHDQVLRAVGRPLIVTSGNIEGDSLEFENDAAHIALSQTTDLFLDHDRQVVRPIDDSVVRVISGRPVTLRAGRGIAPLPLNLDCDRRILAVGAHQKVALAYCNGEQSALGPHLGDLDSLSTRGRFVQHLQQLFELYGGEPELIAHDLHPDYFTTRWAEDQGLPTLAVQHHHAHVVSGMLEHRWLNQTVLGVAFDGTGYGPDDTIWGGEFLVATTCSYQRIARLRPFALPGGDMAVREPWRIGLSLLADTLGKSAALRHLSDRVDESRLHAAAAITSHCSPTTSSMGRLFDAVAAVVLGIDESTFEGEPAMRLEAACDLSAVGVYPWSLDDAGPVAEFDWRPLLRSIIEDQEQGRSPGVIAMKFHRSVASMVAMIAERFPDHPVVLSGGCFQNRVLTKLVVESLNNHTQPVGLPGTIPPNDGGLAAGQLAIAAAHLKSQVADERTGRCV